MFGRDEILRQYEKLGDELKSISAEQVQIIAVTKAHEPEIFQICSELKIKHVGENRIQELKTKCEQFPAERENLYIHFIGNLQSNKAKYLPGRINSLDTLDSLDVVEKLTQRLDPKSGPISALVQLNTSGEQSKSGLGAENYQPILEFASVVQKTEMINLEGVMTMGPTPSADFSMENPQYRKQTANAFQKASEVRKRLEEDLGCQLPRLSMGMSHDYEIAIENGATEIRVGSLLFGARPARH
ncbi:MAG: YggS family pyridoxal phosphate-dependent enzyme [Leptospirales bacterium]